MYVPLKDDYGEVMLLKRILCGIVALIFLMLGAKLTGNSNQLWLAVGLCFFIGGITLAYIAITQHFPNYNFWVTLTAIGLAYVLYLTHYAPVSAEEKQATEARLEKELEKSKQLLGNSDSTISKKEEQKRKTKSTGFNLTAYPKISGSISAIRANVFYINGRYVRLYGVDAPDTDQVCSDSNGSAYNCGEEAISWIRGWIDQNIIDCYLLKVEPNGTNSAICIWGEYDIGAALVGAGWGIANTNETNIYKPYEAKAQSESSGLWQGTFYSPQDWRDIKTRRNDFTIKKRVTTKRDGFFNFGSLF